MALRVKESVRGSLPQTGRLDAKEIVEAVVRAVAETNDAAIAKMSEEFTQVLSEMRRIMQNGGGVSETLTYREGSFVKAESEMLQDIDAILSRLDVGIAREREAMDKLVERLRQPAA